QEVASRESAERPAKGGLQATREFILLCAVGVRRAFLWRVGGLFWSVRSQQPTRQLHPEVIKFLPALGGFVVRLEDFVRLVKWHTIPVDQLLEQHREGTQPPSHGRRPPLA